MFAAARARRRSSPCWSNRGWPPIASIASLIEARSPYGLQFAGIDIALDHYPYNGVTTTCESLYVGVPVISLHGRNFVSRSGLSILDASVSASS